MCKIMKWCLHAQYCQLVLPAAQVFTGRNRQTFDTEACMLQVTQLYLHDVLWCMMVRLVCIWQCSTSRKDRLNEAFGHFWAHTEAGCLDCC